jgi:hypothetical protein
MTTTMKKTATMRVRMRARKMMEMTRNLTYEYEWVSFPHHVLTFEFRRNLSIS